MNVCVFDTETTSLDKPFCYNIGYEIFNTDSGVSLTAKDFVVEQIWHNLPLFQSAYYADKREIYVARMKARQTIMDKFGYITQEMARDFKKLEVVGSYAFNSDFDERVFNYNCDWFKVINPFDNIPIFDIRGYVHQFISNQPEYLDFCEKHELFTESKNYSTTAEAVYRYLTNDIEFAEEHTALADSKIEAFILAHCVKECGRNGKKSMLSIGQLFEMFPLHSKLW
ncbi:MAG: hypothetical protein PHQ86_05495 [Dehalococcoidales bacterium]|nr:hypothetical protein [Dehalococcoidales bacterium]